MRSVIAYGAAGIFVGKPGAHAEKLALSETNIRKMPDTWSYEDAAAYPVGAMTALHGYRQVGGLTNKKVLVIGATGGGGTVEEIVVNVS